MPKFNWINENQPLSRNNSTDKLNRLKQSDKENANKLKQQSTRNIIVKCVWWGEENSRGALFKPKVTNASSGILQDPNKIQTTAKYMIRCGPKQFNAYLNGKKFVMIIIKINRS